MHTRLNNYVANLLLHWHDNFTARNDEQILKEHNHADPGHSLILLQQYQKVTCCYKYYYSIFLPHVPTASNIRPVSVATGAIFCFHV